MFKALCLSLLLLLPLSLNAEEIPAAKRAVVDKLLEVTGALKVGEMMGTAVAEQIIDSSLKQDREIPPRVIDIIKDEVGQVMHEEFIANGFIHKLSYKLYHQHFSTQELQEMVDFYNSPTGSKAARLLPQITQQAMVAGQQHGQSLGPVIQQRLMARFKKEGIQ